MTGLIVAIASGFVDFKELDPQTFKRIRRELRSELLAFRIHLVAAGSGDKYRLCRRYKAKDRRNSGAIDTRFAPLVETCKRALPYITPSNPER